MAKNNGEFICVDGGIDSSDDDLFAAIPEVEDDAPSECLSQITSAGIKQKNMLSHSETLAVVHEVTNHMSNMSTSENQDNITHITIGNEDVFNPTHSISMLIQSPKIGASNPEKDKYTSRLQVSRSSAISESSVNGSAISLLSSQERLDLSSWGLPETVVRAYARKGIHTMFKWQSECLSFPKVLENGGNLVYSAPTSAGKTLVSEILMMKRVFEVKKKAIVILPFVSLAREKMFGLKDLLQSAHIRVGGFMGQHHPPGGFKTVDIAVCTIEKANSLINRLLEEKSLDKLGVIVVDELHLLGDASRGYLLELLITKVQYMTIRNENIRVQIIGMSATLPNLDLLANWLNADLYVTNFRPVPLTEQIKIGNRLLNNSFQLIRELEPLVKIENDTDHLVYLCLETIMNGHSVLVFCPTKMWCEKLAEAVAKEFFRLGKPPTSVKLSGSSNECFVRNKLQEQLKGQRLNEIIEQLKRCPAGLDQALSRSIRFGVAYHHAGLTYDERDIIEGSFKQGALRVLIATSTLSSGVNLPARRVIVRCPFTFQNRLIDTLSYKQMIGRAGRKGIDTEGESILLCRENEKQKVEQLVTSDLEPVSSCLIQGNGETLCSSMKRAILEVIASGVAETPEQVEKYASCTLLSVSMTHESFAQDLTQESKDNSIFSCVKFLEENEFICLKNLETSSSGNIMDSNIKTSAKARYIPTQLGLACLASSLSPDEGLTVLKELQKARKCFVLENELHVIYQVVPIYAAVAWPNLDFMNYLSLWETLPTDRKRVGELVGVEERFLVRAMRGTINTQISTQARLMAIHQRFYTALALHDLVNESSLSTVARKYGANKGMLQSLQQAAATFAGMVTRFCGRLGWLNLELLIGQFQDRFQFGIQRELIDLCRLTTLNGQRARLLFNAGGFESVAQVANARPEDIEILLQNCAPFESGKIFQEGESERDVKERKQIRSFWVTGKKGLTEEEAAKLIVEEAREVLQKDLGIQIADWGHSVNEDNDVIKANGQRRKSMNEKTTSDSNRGNSISPGVTRHMSYLAGAVDINNTSTRRKTRSKGKSPLEKAKQKIKRERERTGTGGIIKKETKRKKSHCTTSVSKNPHVNKLVQAVSSPNLKKANDSSTPVKGHERSFDTSAQIEELFHVQSDDNLNDIITMDSSQSDIAQNRGYVEMKGGINNKEHVKISILKSDIVIGPQYCLQDKNSANDNQGIHTRIPTTTDIRPDAPANGFASIKSHGSDTQHLTLQTSASKKTMKNRVSWHREMKPVDGTSDVVEQQLSNDLPSPPKHAKLETTSPLVSEEGIAINPCASEISILDIPFNDKLVEVPQSTDIFGDSFAFEDLSKFSVVNENSIKASKSCPKTPEFQACSEELIVHVDIRGQSNASSVSSVNTSGINDSCNLNNQILDNANINRKNSLESDFSLGESCWGNSLCSPSQTVANAKDLNVQENTFEKNNPSKYSSVNDTKNTNLINDIKIPLLNHKTYKNDNLLDKVAEKENIFKPPPKITLQENYSITRMGLLGEMKDNRNLKILHQKSLKILSPSKNASKPAKCVEKHLAKKTNMPSLTSEGITNFGGRLRRSVVSPGGVIFSDSDSDAHLESSPMLDLNPLNTNKENTARKNDISPISTIPDKTRILDVCENRTAFNSFVRQVNKETVIGCAFACIHYIKPTSPSRQIGQRVTRRQIRNDRDRQKSNTATCGRSKTEVDPLVCDELNIKVIGLAVSWSKTQVHFISLLSDNNTVSLEVNEKKRVSDNDKKGVTISERLELLTVILTTSIPSQSNKKEALQRTLIALDMARFCKIAQLTFGIVLPSCTPNILMTQKSKREAFKFPLWDPRVALWMLQPGEEEKGMEYFVHTYFYPNDIKESIKGSNTFKPLNGILDCLIGKKSERVTFRNRAKPVLLSCASLALNPTTSTSTSQSKERSLAESLLSFNVMPKLESELSNSGMSKTFHEIEMPSISILVKGDLNGFGFSIPECERLRQIITAKLDQLEDQAHALANRKFRLTSSDDICQVLYRELRLPLNGEEETGKLVASRLRTRNGPIPSSSKEALVKLINYHELPSVIIEWRKINSAISNTLIPLSRASTYQQELKMYRIFPTSNTFTATGRMSMHEPSIQMVPRDFNVEISPQLVAKVTKGHRDANITGDVLSTGSLLMTSYTSLLCLYEDKNSTFEQDKLYTLSLRRAFVPSNGCLLIAADYSQLELRILAHLSGDRKLTQLLQQNDGDVFKLIAASWLQKKVGEISLDERQRAKQICYGILYGMGAKALSEQLDQNISEAEALLFMSSFKTAYPEVQNYIEEIKSKCRKQGFVETITGRRRYLPNINLPGNNSCGKFGGNEYARAAAERQAVNTTVQGTAADLLKKSMINIDISLFEAFPLSVNRCRKGGASVTSGAFLVLQLHDELIYEVFTDDVVQVAQIIRIQMENAIKLNVPTPVKIRIGPSWGELQTLKEM